MRVVSSGKPSRAPRKNHNGSNFQIYESWWTSVEMKAEGHQCKGTIFFSNSTSDWISTFFILDIEPGAKVKLHFHKILNGMVKMLSILRTRFFYEFLCPLLFLKKVLLIKKSSFKVIIWDNLRLSRLVNYENESRAADE